MRNEVKEERKRNRGERKEGKSEGSDYTKLISRVPM